MSHPALKRFVLPSGRTIRYVAHPGGDPISSDVFEGTDRIGGRLMTALASGQLLVEGVDASIISGWPTPDFDALRDLAWRLGIIGTGLGELVCDNCDAKLTIPPREVLLRDIEDWYAEGDRGFFPVVCEKCGAVHEIASPPDRELETEIDDGPQLRVTTHRLPGLAEFVRWVDRIGEEVYRARQVANIEIVVADGPTPVDGSGAPLLGSYEPVTEIMGIATDLSFRITLYYQTFERSFEEEPYDVEAEIRETIDHEVQHHLHNLSGHDPLDEQERQEAERDLERTFGKKAVHRAHANEWLQVALVIAAIALIVALLLVVGSPR